MSSETNEIKTYFGRCRCCLNYSYLKNMWEEHYWEGEKEIYVDMLVQCFALSWEQSDDSKDDDQICESCIKRLRDAYTFKKVVLESQEELLGLVDNESNVPVKIEKVDYTLVYKEKDGSRTADDGDYIDDPDDPDYIDPDDPEDNDDSADPNAMEYEEVEYLEDIDENRDALAAQVNTRTGRRSNTPTLAGSDGKWPRKLPKAARYKTYKQYTEEDLRKCVEAVRSEEMTSTEASEKFNIPKKTICAKIKIDPKDVQNDKTTTDKHKTERIKRKRPTIFRPNPLKIKNIKKIAARKIKIENSSKEDIIKDEDDVNKLLLDIKTEASDLLDVPVNADEVRHKYKAIVNAKFKKENPEAEKSDDNEMDKHKINIKHILECSNATLLKGFWGNGYSCCFCDIQKDNPAELKIHNLETHVCSADKAVKVKYVSDLVMRLDITGLKCKLCDENIDSLEALTDHLIEIHNKNIHRDVKNYIIPFKFETDALQCIKCRKEFKYFKLLSEHMSEHYRNYECPVCERSFINKQSMQTHSYRHKSGVFKCTHCPKVFDTRPKRSVHERVTHTLCNKTRKCNYCDERFSTKDLVLSHEAKVHGAKIPIFNCQACNKSYNSQSSLMTHRKRYHLMLRPHKCSYCEMAFFSRIELRSHTVTHTKSRDFKCDICNKCFGTRCSLNQHVRGHLDDRRFKCDSCERAFVHRTAFKVHMRSKHGRIV